MELDKFVGKRITVNYPGGFQITGLCVGLATVISGTDFRPMLLLQLDEPLTREQDGGTLSVSVIPVSVNI